MLTKPIKTAKETQRAVKKYLRRVKRLLPCPREARREILAELEGQIAEAVNCGDVRGEEDLYEVFGAPEEVARAAYRQEDDLRLQKNARKYRIGIGIAVAAIALVASLWVLAIIFQPFAGKETVWIDRTTDTEAEEETDSASLKILPQSY